MTDDDDDLQVVIALASLLAPLPCIGDVRPYMSRLDSDIITITSRVQLKHLHAQQQQV
jgi:hypothetical protein